MQNHSVHIVGAIGIWQAWKPHEGFQTSRDNVQIRSKECSRQVQKSKLNQTSNSQSKHQGTFEWHGWNLLRFVEQKGSLLLHITIGLCTACISSLSPPNEAMKGGHQHHNGNPRKHHHHHHYHNPNMGVPQNCLQWKFYSTWWFENTFFPINIPKLFQSILTQVLFCCPYKDLSVEFRVRGWGWSSGRWRSCHRISIAWMGRIGSVTCLVEPLQTSA